MRMPDFFFKLVETRMQSIPQPRNRKSTLLCERMLQRYFKLRHQMGPAQKVRALRRIALAMRYGWTRLTEVHEGHRALRER